jgi:hypothetical protein
MNILIYYINKKIIDVRMKNRLNEHIQNIMKNNGEIKIKNKIIIKNNNQILIIEKQKNHIKYIYKDKKNKEQYQIFKINKEYISEYINKNQKQISLFKDEKEIIKHIEEKKQETTYIRTLENNIILIEKTLENIKYYIGINENKYEDYLQENVIFSEIEKDEFKNIISKKIKEEKILEKYLSTGKKLHLH